MRAKHDLLLLEKRMNNNCLKIKCSEKICEPKNGEVNEHFTILREPNESRNSLVGIALGYGLDERGSMFQFPAGAGNSSLHHRVQNGSGPIQPPIQWVPGVPFTFYMGLMGNLGVYPGC
jgi:hypothetical protein